MNIMQLIHFEFSKLFKRKILQIILTIFLIILTINAFLIYEEKAISEVEKSEWRDELIVKDANLLEELKSLEKIEHLTANENAIIEDIKNQLLIDQYRLTYDIQPESIYTSLDVVRDYKKIVSIILLLLIYISSYIVAHEFEYGTINSVLLKRSSRIEVLLSKYLTVLILLTLSFILLFSFSFALGIFMFNHTATQYVTLSVIDNTVVEFSKLGSLIQSYIFNYLVSISYLTLSFLFSTLFKRRVLAFLSSLIVLIFGQFSNVLISDFSWSKFWLFQNTNFENYLVSSIIDHSSQTVFSIVVILSYTAIFLISSFLIFCKNDIRV